MNLKEIILKSYKKLIFNLKKKINLDLKKIDIILLNELFNYFGTDKGTAVKNPYNKNIDTSEKILIGHGYAKFYESYFHPFKDKEIRLLEIGTWKGASVASFYYYFKKGIIFCIDRNYKFQFYSKRVNFFYCDTRNNKDIKKFENFLTNKNSKFFDIIIDDGSHIYSDILSNFQRFFKKVNSGGLYVIEDFNHYKYYPHLDDSSNDSLDIDVLFKLLKTKKNFESCHLSKDFQNFCFDNIEEIIIEKGLQIDSYIAFIKKK